MDDVTKAINHFSVLMEDQNSKLDAVLEAVDDMQKKVSVLPRIEQRLEALEQDIKVVKAVVTATNRDLEQHKSLPTHVAHGRAEIVASVLSAGVIYWRLSIIRSQVMWLPFSLCNVSSASRCLSAGDVLMDALKSDI